MRLGVDKACRLLAGELRGLGIGVITNASAINSGAEIGVLRLSRCLDIREVYAPEHGFWSSLQAGEPVETYYDPQLGLRVTSLYKGGEEAEEAWSRVDALIYDLQDVGVRTYTYLYLLYKAVRYSADTDTPLYVLDRPNPLGGTVEGPVSRGEAMPVAVPWIPLRYGLTPGELALFYASRIGGRVRVVPMDGWRRAFFRETGLPWAPPSPAISSPETALVYAGTVLFEATNLSEGRGTYSPFLQIGAPWLDNMGIVEEVGRSIPGARLRPVEFRPLSSKYAGERCKGIYIHVLDERRFRAVEAAVRILSAIIKRHGEFEWLRGRDGFLIDMLTPGAEMRSLGDRDPEDLLEKWRKRIQAYVSETSEILLYGEGLEA